MNSNAKYPSPKNGSMNAIEMKAVENSNGNGIMSHRNSSSHNLNYKSTGGNSGSKSVTKECPQFSNIKMKNKSHVQ